MGMNLHRLEPRLADGRAEQEVQHLERTYFGAGGRAPRWWQ